MPLKLQLLCVDWLSAFRHIICCFSIAKPFHLFHSLILHLSLSFSCIFSYSIQKTQRCCNFTEIWLTLAAFREARANVLWRILNLDVWSSTDCEGGNSSPHLIRHRDPDPNTELIEPVNTSAPYHHVKKGFLDTNAVFPGGIRIISRAKCEDRKNQMTFFFVLKYCDRMYSTSSCFCIYPQWPPKFLM